LSEPTTSRQNQLHAAMHMVRSAPLIQVLYVPWEIVSVTKHSRHCKTFEKKEQK